MGLRIFTFILLASTIIRQKYYTIRKSKLRKDQKAKLRKVKLQWERAIKLVNRKAKTKKSENQ